MQTQGSMSRQYGAAEGYGGASDFDGCVAFRCFSLARFQIRLSHLVLEKPSKRYITSEIVLTCPHIRSRMRLSSPDYGYGDEGSYYNQEPQAGSSAPNQRYR